MIDLTRPCSVCGRRHASTEHHLLNFCSDSCASDARFMTTFICVSCGLEHPKEKRRDRSKCKNPTCASRYAALYHNLTPERIAHARRLHRNFTKKRRTTSKESWIVHILSKKHDWCASQGVPFSLEIGDLDIPEYCPVLHYVRIKYPFEHPEVKHGDPAYPTLDRIVPELGYVKGNVRIICSRANRLKDNSTPEETWYLYQDHIKYLPPDHGIHLWEETQTVDATISHLQSMMLYADKLDRDDLRKLSRQQRIIMLTELLTEEAEEGDGTIHESLKALPIFPEGMMQFEFRNNHSYEGLTRIA